MISKSINKNMILRSIENFNALIPIQAVKVTILSMKKNLSKMGKFILYYELKGTLEYSCAAHVIIKIMELIEGINISLEINYRISLINNYKVLFALL